MAKGLGSHWPAYASIDLALLAIIGTLNIPVTAALA